MQIYSPIITGSLGITGSVVITGSLKVSSGITGSLLGTASYASTVAGFGPGTNNYIPRWSGTSAIVNSAIYNNSSLVGINTSSPSYQLDVNGTIRANTYIYLGGGSNSEYAIEIGKDRTGNGYAYLDLTGDATYTDYGLRIIRGATGANTTSNITHRGAGTFTIETLESGSISFNTNNSRRLLIDGTGSIVITGSALKIDIPSRANGYVLTSDASGSATWQPSSGGGSFPYSGSAVITGSLTLKSDELEYIRINPKNSTSSWYGNNLLPTNIQNIGGWSMFSSNYFANYSWGQGELLRNGQASSIMIGGGGMQVMSTYQNTTGSTAYLNAGLFATDQTSTRVYNIVDGTTNPQDYNVTINLSNKSLYYEEKPSFPTLNIYNFLNFS